MRRRILVAAAAGALAGAFYACAPFGEGDSSGVDAGEAVDGAGDSATVADTGGGTVDAAAVDGAAAPDAAEVDGGTVFVDAGPCAITTASCAASEFPTAFMSTAFDSSSLGSFALNGRNQGGATGSLVGDAYTSPPQSFGVHFPPTAAGDGGVAAPIYTLDAPHALTRVCLEACIYVDRHAGNWGANSYLKLVHFSSEAKQSAATSIDLGIDGDYEWYLQTQRETGGPQRLTVQASFGQWSHILMKVDMGTKGVELSVDGLDKKANLGNSMTPTDLSVHFDVGGDGANGTPDVSVHYDDFYARIAP